MSTGSSGRLSGKRAFAITRDLLPAVKPNIPFAHITQAPAHGFLSWTFGRGTVIWKIWPAVLLYTVFAAVIVYLEEQVGVKNLGIPNVMLSVVGVILGFVISYRAMSGYDRYWQGRTAWSDLMNHSRGLGRLIWYHVPPLLSQRTAEELSTGLMNRTNSELLKVMAEKRMALDLILGFAVAMKHHLRGELGIYFEDLYHLVRPLHEHDHTPEQKQAAMTSALSPRARARRIASNPALPNAAGISEESSPPKRQHRVHYHTEHENSSENTYGTFLPISESPRGSLHRVPSNASVGSQHQVLAPSQQPGNQDLMDDVSTELIPFGGMFASIRRWFSRKNSYSELPTSEIRKDPWSYDASQRKWSGPLQLRIGKKRHTISDTSRGENLPLEILRCMSEWSSVLELRNTVPGTSLGSILGGIASLEATVAVLEQILTTPLPFVYAAHIRHTVWVYLFFLPFQLVSEFKWHTVPGVTIAAFVYLGFLAAGEEIEQPFGYDENDLDLDMFCKEIIAVDIANLKKSPCLNAYLPPTPQTQRLVRHRSMTLSEATAKELSDSDYEY